MFLAANGLKITLNIEEDEYTPTNDLDGAAEDAGIKWMLHHPTVPPYVKELGHGAGPGHHTFVAVRHETVSWCMGGFGCGIFTAVTR